MLPILPRKNWGLQKPPVGTLVNTEHPLANGLLSCYMLAEPGGTLIVDSIGVTSLATANSPTRVAGRFGSALSLNNASSQNATTANSASYNVTNYTIVAWVNRAGSGSTNNAIFSRTPGSSAGQFYFYIANSTNVLGLDIPFVAGGVVSGTTALSTNTWYQVALTKSGSNYAVYVNGNVDGTATNAGTPTFTGSITLGSSASQFFNGKIDNLMFYGRPLSGAEIQQLYVQPFAMMRAPVAYAGTFQTAFNTIFGIQSIQGPSTIQF